MKLFNLTLVTLSIFLASCGGIKDAVDNANTYMPQIGDLKHNTQDTNEYLQKMLAGVHDQTLKQTMELIKDKNNEVYYPLPTAFMIGAKKFAEAATPDELVELAKVWLWQVDFWKVDEVNSALSKYASLGKKVTKLRNSSDSTDSKNLTDLLAQQTTLKSQLAHQFHEYNLNKLITLISLKCIAGLTPSKTIREFYNTQVAHSRGRYPKAAKAFLAFRAEFIKTYILDGDIFQNGGVVNADSLKMALDYTSELDFLRGLPEAGKLIAQTTGIFPEDLSYPENRANEDVQVMNVLSSLNLQNAWETLKGFSDTVALDNSLDTAERMKIPAMQIEVNRKAKYWATEAAK